MANMRIIGFNDRTAELRRIRLGYEGDNLVERLEFMLPEIAQGQTATLLITGVDAVKLDRTDEGRYAVDLTRDMIGPDGEREAYVRVDGAGGKVWQSAPMRLITGALPDVEEEIEKIYPTAVGQMLTAMAEHSGEMAAQEERIEQEANRAENAADALNDPDVIARTLVPEGEASAEWTVVNGRPTLTLNIPRGKPGDKGDKGDKGDTPVKGIDYTDGKDGVGIADITVERAINPYNRDAWEVTFKTTDGRETSYVVADGKDGRTPIKGLDYTDGAPGPGITDLTITERTDAAGRRYHQVVIMWEEALNGSIIKAGQSFNVYDGVDGEPGKSGKTAYQYALDGGYTGTEAEFAAKMAQEIPSLDTTLTQEGAAADAAAVGREFSALYKEIVFDPTTYGLPILALTGDISAMTKENAVDLAYEYEGRSGMASVKWQGSSSLSYPKKNFTVKFDNAFEAATGWGAQKKYCMKANFIDHSHARNIVSAKLWGQIVKAKPTDGFDMAACKGMLNASDNSVVSGTEPVDGVITISQHLSNHGFRYIDGYVCEKDLVYSLEADVFVTSANAEKDVILGVGATTSDGIYAKETVETNKWCRVSAQFANPYENGRLSLMLESAESTEKLQFKNVTIKHSIGKNKFDAANASLVDATGADISFAGSVNGGNVVINQSLYNRDVCIGGTTYPKGKYSIAFSAATSNLESVVGYEISVGFAKNTTRNATMVKLEAQYARHWFTLEVENELDDAYLTIQPIGGQNKENSNMGFSFNAIAVYDGTLVEGTSNQIVASPNGGAIDGFPIIITINGAFQGLYTLNIPKDGWMMSMGNGDHEAILCAEYSEPCWFRAEAKLDGSDFDLEYATDENDTEWIVTSVNRLINACRNSDGTDLDTTVAQYLDWGSAIDYFIFKKLLNGVDMGGKNYLLATYDGVKWFFSAYDMDCVYGLDWDGKKYYKAANGTAVTESGHTVDVLIVTYKKEELKQRYAELRTGILSDDNFATTIANFIGGIPTPVYLEDAKKWPTIPNTATNNLHQIVDYYCRRAAILDKVFEEL